MKFWSATAAALAAILAGAGGASADGIEVREPWVRASLGMVPNSAAYMTIESAAPDRLIGASSPAAARVELHNTMEHAGVSQMRPVEALEVGPGRPAVLQPGGLHLMVMGLEERLVEGGTLPLELTFETAGTVEVQAEVRGIGATGGGGHGSGHAPAGHGMGGRAPGG